MPANAQKRSLTITTPFGRAMPPSRGSELSPSARSKKSSDCPTHSVVAHEGPPRLSGTAHLLCADGPSVRLPDAAREEAEQREYQDDDQDDPEDSHFSSPFFR